MKQRSDAGKPARSFEYYQKRITEAHPSYTVLDSGLGRSRDKWTLHCSTCNVDFKATLNDFTGVRSYRKPCKCSKNPRVTKEEWLERIAVLAKDRYSYHIDKFEYGNTRVRMRCLICSRHFTNDLEHLHLRKQGCPRCAGCEKRTTEEFIEKVSKVQLPHLDYSKTQYKNHKAKVEVICKKCDQVFLQSVVAAYEGLGCPVCDSSKRSYNTDQGISSFYLQEVEDTKGRYLKFGVAYNVHRRICQQRNKSNAKHTLLLEMRSTPRKVWSIERKVKSMFNCGVVKPCRLPDGFTETLNITDLSNVIITATKELKNVA